MIYRGVKLQAEEQKRSRRKDWLKAIAITVVTAAVIAGIVVGVSQLGI